MFRVHTIRKALAYALVPPALVLASTGLFLLIWGAGERRSKGLEMERRQKEAGETSGERSGERSARDALVSSVFADLRAMSRVTRDGQGMLREVFAPAGDKLRSSELAQNLRALRTL